MAELSHSIKIKRNWFMRLFIWFWDAEGAPLNTCLIFWGTLAMIIGWPLRLLLAGLGAILRPLGEYIDSRQKDDPEPYVPPTPVNDESKEPSRGMRFLTKLSDLAGAFWFKFQTPITWTFRILVGCAILAVVAYAIYGLTTVAWSWSILWFTLEFLGIIIGVTALAVPLAYVADKRGRRNKPKRHLIRRIYHAVHDHTCANVVVE